MRRSPGGSTSLLIFRCLMSRFAGLSGIAALEPRFPGRLMWTWISLRLLLSWRAGTSGRRLFTAAYLAAEADRAVSMADLAGAVAREYRKLGRLVLEREFGKYVGLLSRGSSF